MNHRARKSTVTVAERWEPAIVVGLFLLALIPRLHQIDAAPPGLNGDEVYNLIDALAIDGGNLPAFMPGNLGREAFYFYLLALSLRFFGVSVFALRLPSVLLGSGAVALTYLVGRDIFNRRVGLVAAGLIAVSLWPILLSRLALRAISLTFMSTLTVYWLHRALKEGRRRDWLLGGTALGLTMYTYIPSRVFPLVIAGWLVWVFWRRREQLRANSRLLALSLLVAAFVFAPMGLYMLNHSDVVNQRLVSMGNALDRARAGEPEALLASVGGTLKMFSIEGDAEWRYHLAHRPVFDPVTSVFFYLGLALSVWGAFRGDPTERRQPEFALLLLWLGAMVAPNAVLNENPSFIRAAGAIAPVFLLTGVGVDAALDRLQAHVEAARWLGPFLLGFGLVLSFVYAAHGYFGVWRNHPEVRAVYHADLAMMGRYLEANAPPPGTRVFVAYEYVYDRPTVLNLALFTDEPVAWFAQEDTFAWAADGEVEGEPAWYMVPAEHELPGDVVQQLETRAEREVVRYDGGAPAFTLYRVWEGGAALGPETDLSLSFKGGPQLTGYDVAETAFSGERLGVRLYWQVPPALEGTANNLTYVQVHVADATGVVRARADKLLGYPQAGWRAGDVFIQDLSLALPAGMVPGPASLSIGLRGGQGQLLDEMKKPPGESQLLVRSRPLENFALTEDMTVYDDALALAGAAFRPFVTPGASLNVELNWVALQRLPEDYRVRLKLIGSDGERPLVSQTFELWPGLYPPTEWQVHEAVSTLHGLKIPVDISPEDPMTLHVDLLPPESSDDGPVPVSEGSSLIGELTPDERPRRFEPPTVAHATDVRFGEDIRLLGYELETDRAYPGGALGLTLVWQAIATPDDNYTVFNHLRGADGQQKGQFDSPPVGDAWLTETWLPGEVVVEERDIPIDADAAPGPALLIVGLYTADDLQRLPVTEGGEGSESDHVVLQNVEIMSAPAGR